MDEQRYKVQRVRFDGRIELIASASNLTKDAARNYCNKFIYLECRGPTAAPYTYAYLETN